MFAERSIRVWGDAGSRRPSPGAALRSRTSG